MGILKSENARKDIPLVSIIAVCYNHEKYVEETLDSILNQSFANIELVIIDSNSSDNSVEIIEKWIEKNKIHCRFIKQSKPKSICQNLNEALTQIKGEYFQPISCDDVLEKNKIERQVQVFMRSCESLSLVYGDLIPIDESGNRISTSTYFEEKNWNNQTDLPSGKIFNEFLATFIIKAPTVLLRKKHVLEVGGYNETYRFEDVQMWFALTSQFAITGCFDAKTYYRVLPSSLFHSSKNKSIKKEYINLFSSYRKKSKMSDFQKIYLSLRLLKSKNRLLFSIFRKLLFNI